LFESLQNNDDNNSKKQSDQDLNRGLALLVLLSVSVVGASWLFFLPVYFDMKIVAQVFPILFSISLLLLVTKIQHVYLNKASPVLGFLAAFWSWAYVIYLNTNMIPQVEKIKNVMDVHYLGMSHTTYIFGLCLIMLWSVRYLKCNLYLSVISVLTLVTLLFVFTEADIFVLLAPATLLLMSAMFSVVTFSNVNKVNVSHSKDEFIDDEMLLPSELIVDEIKPELDINILPLNESSITHDWELILRELHTELKNTTDVDQLFKSMLTFLHGAMEFDAAAVGMLQDKSLKRIATFGGDEYLHTQSLNWTNQRVKKIFSTREPILSSQSNLSATTDAVTQPVHRLDVPIISNKKVFGLVTLFRDELLFDAHDVKLSCSIVFHSMIALRQARMQEEIDRLNNYSPQTKLTLYSREQFVNRVKPVFEKLSRPRECSLFIVEVDNLDVVIDKQGRDAGGVLYKAVSKKIMSQLKVADILGRYGNDGFVILQDETDLMHAKAIAEKIRIDVSKMKLKYQNNVLTTTVSIGLTIVSDPEEGLPSLMRKADMGLFVAKENGSNTIKVSL